MLKTPINFVKSKMNFDEWGKLLVEWYELFSASIFLSKLDQGFNEKSTFKSN